ncbi:unnamed protein product [Cladocopium goreaui]|uniref:Uncharacterized protein n=1 Tax=Cladocopium goreaui TaxID=2562237 RepID=A0A9P1CWL7_9DINO|nr:unnamed protein product [Cladocopium goreaui]
MYLQGSSRADFNAARNVSTASRVSQSIDMGYPPIRSYTGALAETYSTYLGGGKPNPITSSEPPPISLGGITSLSESLAAMQAPHESALDRVRSVLHTAPKAGHHAVRYASGHPHETASHDSGQAEGHGVAHVAHVPHPSWGKTRNESGHGEHGHGGHGHVQLGSHVQHVQGVQSVHGHAMSSTESVARGTPVSSHMRQNDRN